METICPLSNSPCSGVLKFRLASNASANVASAVSLLWVMDGKAFQWDGSLDGEIGWAAYLTRSFHTLATEQRRHRFVSSAHGFAGVLTPRKFFLRPTCRPQNADLHWGSLTRRMLHRRCQRRD